MTKIVCSMCGQKKWRPRAWLRGVKNPTCSRKCNGRREYRTGRLAAGAPKGWAWWTPSRRKAQGKKMRGPNSPAWKGGVTYLRKHGNYKPIKYVRCPLAFVTMARKDGYVMEHRLLVAKALGRVLARTEVVHHINHDPQDNRLTNLMLFASNSDHKRYEARGTPAPIWRG